MNALWAAFLALMMATPEAWSAWHEVTEPIMGTRVHAELRHVVSHADRIVEHSLVHEPGNPDAGDRL